MHKYILAIFFWSHFFCSCSDSSKKFKKEKIVLNEEVFIGKAQKFETDDSVISQTLIDLQKVFRLKPLNKSNDEQEVRLYFNGPFAERFFVQKFNSGHLTVELYNCMTDIRNDSLLMKIVSLIKMSGIYHEDSLIKADFYSTPKRIINKASEPGLLDDWNLYFIEVKNASSIKIGAINKPFDSEFKDDNEKSIANFIRRINKKYNFHFSDEWIIIDTAAFKNW